jgi:uncharacterized protein (TIGR04255 family)
MTFGLDEPRVIFERSPLKVVVAQLRFPPIYALEQAAGVAPFQAALRGLFPIAEPRGHGIALSLGPQALSAQQPQAGPWRFLNDDGTWIAAIAPDFVSIETTAYERFETFYQRCDAVLRAAKDTVPLDRRGRLGLRYVDEITHPDAVTVGDWRRFLRSDLIGVAGGELLSEYVRAALQQIELDLPIGKAVVRHGYRRLGETASSYVIDLDVFDDTPRLLDHEETMGQVAQFKRWAWGFFSRSITPELRDYLQPRDLE